MKYRSTLGLIVILLLSFAMVDKQVSGQLLEVPSVQQQDVRAVSFNRTSAVNWAKTNNYNNAGFYGASHGRWCTTLIANAWAEGGLPDVPRSWIGNQQIVWWMQAHPDLWEFRSIDQLQPGDIILYSDNPNAPGNWSYTNGWSLWQHVALVSGTNLVTSWNAEYASLNAYAYTSLPYRLGVHIRTDEATGGPSGASHQGTLTYGATQSRTLVGNPADPSGAGHRWMFYAQPSYNQVLVDIQPVSGTLTGDLILTDSSGNPLVTTRTSTTGRGIVLYNTPTAQNLYLHYYADDQTSGQYNITVWSQSIPMIRYEWNWQDSHSHVRHWRGPVGTNTSFYFIIERLSGNFEYTWRLENDGGGLLGTGSSSTGAAIIPGYGTGMMHVKLTPTSGSGSYRIGLRSGNPAPTPPLITGLVNGVTVGRDFDINLLPGMHDQEGSPRYQVQIDNNSSFASPEYDSGWTSSTTFSLVAALPAGSYYLRARQGNTTGEASVFTSTVSMNVTNSVKTGQALLNRGFETAPAGKLSNWSLVNPTSDGRICNTVSKLHSYSGQCAFRFTGGTVPAQLVQSVLSDALPGYTLTLSGYMKTKKLKGINTLMVVVKYQNGTQSKQMYNIPEGTSDWTPFSSSQTLNSVVKKIIVRAVGKGTSGQFYLDDVSLIIGSTARDVQQEPLPVPDAPSGFRRQN